MNSLFINGEKQQIDLHGIIQNPTQEHIADYISLHVAMDNYKNCEIKIGNKKYSVENFYKMLWG